MKGTHVQVKGLLGLLVCVDEETYLLLQVQILARYTPSTFHAAPAAGVCRRATSLAAARTRSGLGWTLNLSSPVLSFVEKNKK